MLQSYAAWYQLISSHPTTCIAVGWRLDDPDPFPQSPLFYLYPTSILLSIHDFIRSSFQYLILNYILVNYFIIHACFAWNQLSSSHGPHPFPGPTHSAGEGGLMMMMMMIMAGGCGGTHNLDHIYIFIWLLCGSKIPSFSVWCLREKFHWKIDHDYIPFVRRLVDVTHYWRSRLFWNTRSIKSVFFQHAEVFLGTKHLSLNANDNDGCLSYSKGEAEASAKLFFRDKLLQCNKKNMKKYTPDFQPPCRDAEKLFGSAGSFLTEKASACILFEKPGGGGVATSVLEDCLCDVLLGKSIGATRSRLDVCWCPKFTWQTPTWRVLEHFVP